MSDPAQLYEAILTGNAKQAEEVTNAALEAGANPTELLGNYMIPAMDEVGKRFECNEYFVPELLSAARAMKTALEILTPKLAEIGAESVGRVVIGTVHHSDRVFRHLVPTDVIVVRTHDHPFRRQAALPR